MFFDQLFIKKEFNQIIGRKHIALVILSAMLTLCFVALGHVIGGYNDLRERLTNPYTNWVSISSSYQNKDELKEARRGVSEIKDEFNILNIITYEIEYLDIFPPQSLDNPYRIKLRNVDNEDPLFSALISKDNVLTKHDQMDYDITCTVLVKLDALRIIYGDLVDDANFRNGLKYLIVRKPTNSDGSPARVLPIHYIVKNLPDKADLIITDNLFKLIYGSREDTKFIKEIDNKYKYILLDTQFEEQILADISIYLRAIPEDVEHKDLDFNGTDYRQFKLFFDGKYSYDTLKVLTEILNKKYLKNGFLSVVDWECYPYEGRPNNNDDSYAFYFKDLSKVREFSKYVKENYPSVEVSIEQVESKDNFRRVSGLATIFILLLIIFSVVSVLLFIQNLLKQHFEKIKPNLGTLKAFGLSDKKIKSLYMQVLLRFFGLASLIALMVFFVYGVILAVINPDILKFDMFTWWIPMIWVVLLISVIIFFNQIIKKVLFRSPGDLIYGRE